MTPQANKRKGYTFEADVADVFRDEYPDVRRNGNIYGRDDRGDLGNVTDWTLQLKNVGQDSWTRWFEETEEQSVRNSTPWWAVIRKVRGKHARASVFAMPLWKAKELMVYLRDLERYVQYLTAEIKSLKTQTREQ